MDKFCLPKQEYNEFLNHLLFNRRIDNKELAFLIERAKDYFDCNLIGSNHYLSIIIEWLLKNDELDDDFVKTVYQLQQLIFFTIEEHDYKFINELYTNHFPEACNKHRQEYLLAIQKDNNELINILKSKAGESFEEDLNRIMNTYYEIQIRN